MTHTAPLAESTKSPSLARLIIVVVAITLFTFGMSFLENTGALASQKFDIALYLGSLVTVVLLIVLLIADLMEAPHVLIGVSGCLLLALYPFLELCHAWPF